MKVLTQAFCTKLTTTNSLNTLVGGRFYNTSAPEQEVFPYVVFSFPQQTPTELLDTTVIEDCDVDFKLYSQQESSGQVYDMFDYLCLLLDDGSLSITGYTHVRLNRVSSQLQYYAEDRVWEYTVRYHVVCYKR